MAFGPRALCKGRAHFCSKLWPAPSTHAHAAHAHTNARRTHTNNHAALHPVPQVSLRHFTEFAAFVCEMFVFAYLGLQVATMPHVFDFGLFFTGAAG